MKNSIKILVTVATVTFFTACSSHYVSKEPTYQETYRSPNPGNGYIWIEGNWIWNNRTKTYHREEGNWQKQLRNRTYKHGHWNKTKRGIRWQKGKWH